ncbi:MAG: acyltransferase family protein [Propionibacteriaceae bacterium]|nr:acyltransferase family protein [Propionibacteriaceae bacterium]
MHEIGHAGGPREAGQRRGRIHGLDALRGGALLLGIVLHGLMPYANGFHWMVEDPQRAWWPLPVVAAIHTFRMTLFLLLAGYFGHWLRQRRGTRGYLLDRVKRIGLPTFAFWPVAVLPLGLCAIWHLRRTGVDAVPPDIADRGGASLGHLWFLWVLLQCIVITLGIRAAAIRLAPHAALAWSSTVARWLSSPGGVLLAALPYAVTTVIQGDRSGVVAPVSLMPDAVSLPAHLGAFAVGWLLARDPWALSRLREQAFAHTVVAAVAMAAALVATDAIPVGLPVPQPLWSTLIALAGWTTSYALIGLATRYLNTERPWIRYLADASYWMYLMHLVVQTFGAVILAGLSWPMPVKLSVNMVVSTALLVVSYDWFVRSTWLGAWINGRRLPRRGLGLSVPPERGSLSS